MRPEPEILLQWIKPEHTPREIECTKLLKPGDYEIYVARLDQILLEAREAFVRMGVSGMIRSGDLAVGLYTPGGDMVTTSCGSFMHVVCSQLPIKYIVKNYAGDPTVMVREGDIFYANEALYGGFHNPDQMAIMPIFANGELIAWASAISHQPETGGAKPGGMLVQAQTRYEEGMRLPPIKIGENYRLRGDMMEMFINFIGRAPRMQDLDVRARATGCDRLRLRIQELAQEVGNDFLLGLFRYMIVIGEQAAKKRLREWNDGIYRSVNFGDALGMVEALYRFAVTFRKEDDHLIVDFSGTSPEHDAGSYHCPAHGMPGWLALLLYCYAFNDLPVSCGPMAPFDFVVPTGTSLNPGPDAAVSCGPPFASTMLTSMYNCFAKMLFDSPQRDCVVASCATGAGMNVSGINQDGVRFADVLSYPLNTGGQGARVDMDGEDCYGFHMAPHSRAPDLDETEAEEPFVHLFQRKLKDSVGFGKYRSGAGTVQAYAVYEAPQLVYTNTAKETRIHSSVGLFGGYPAAAKFGLEIRGSNLWEKMKRGDKDIPSSFQELLTKRSIQGEYKFETNLRPARFVEPGDVWCFMVGGTGGYGDVLEREPELVAKDVKEEIISLWTARNIFKVECDPETLKVDHRKTEELRRKEREDRIRRGRPFSEFLKDWLHRKPPEEILTYYGSWPDAQRTREVVRM